MRSLTDHLRYQCILFFSFLFVVLCVYGNALGHPFMLEDEDIFGFWFRPLSWESFLACFDPNSRNIIYFRPVVSLFNLLLYNVTGGDVVFYRMASMILYAAFLMVTYALSRRLFRETYPALLAVSLYAVHPLHNLYINHLSSSAIIVWGIFFVGALLAHLLNLEEKKNVWSWVSYGLVILALATHEMTVTFPGYVFLLNIYMGKPWRETLENVFIYGGLITVLLAGRSMIVLSTGGMYPMVKTGAAVLGLDAENYLSTLGVLVGWYLKQLVWPTELLLMKTIPLVISYAGMINACILGVLAVLGAVVVFARNIKIKFLILWLAVGLAPFSVSSLIYPFDGLTIEPTWFMVGSFSFFWAVAWLFSESGRMLGRGISLTVFLVVFISAAVYTQQFNHVWRSQRSYCLYWLSLVPGQKIANFWLATDYAQTREFALAQEHFNRALNGSYVDWEVFVNLGVIASRQQDWDKAVMWSRKALAINPSAAEAYNNLGVIAFENNDLSRAQGYFQNALQADSMFEQAGENLKIVKKRLAVEQ